MTAPPTPELGQRLFGPELHRAQRYAELLATDGVDHGLLGPREVERLWDRHLINCALLARLPADVLPNRATVVDVGSGAGLPGIPLALVRPDLRIVLLEPLARRAAFLTAACETLGLDLEVIRGRAEDATVRRDLPPADVVAARAVAPLDRLARWCLPLLVPGGIMVAIKGATAPDEVRRTSAVIRRLGVERIEVTHCGVGEADPPTTVVTVRAGARRG